MAEAIRVEVVAALPDDQRIVRLTLPDGSTVADAWHAALGREPSLASVAVRAFGVFGRRVLPAATLRDGDRVEAYRTLNADAKDARRARARRRSAPAGA